MPLPLIYHKCVVIYSLILLYLSNESQSTLKFTQCQINAGFPWTLVLVRGHLYVCLWYFKQNTNMKFHTCDVVVGSRGCVMYIWGWVSHVALIWVSLFIYFIFICITASPHRRVILWILFISSLYVGRFCTSEIECNSHAGFVWHCVELLVVNICEMLLSIYLLISWVACNLTYSVPSLWICIM